MSGWTKTALVLANIGALNWGLNELGWNAVPGLLGWAGDVTVMMVYYIVALCGLYGLYAVFKK